MNKSFYRLYYSTLLCVCIGCICISNNVYTQPFYSFTVASERSKTDQELYNKIATIQHLSLADTNFSKFKSAYWAMELMLHKPKWFPKIAKKHFDSLTNTPVHYQQAFIELIYTLYPKEFTKEVLKIWHLLGNDKVKVMALEYLALSNIFPKIPTGSENNLYYQLYQKNIQRTKSVIQLKEILNANFLPNQIIVVSAQHHDRNKPGYLMIRTAKHEWLKNEKGTIAKFTQLARSITNLPYYITNGNTPQGIYKLEGFDSSSNRFIGPTKNLQMRLPFEISDSAFYSNDKKNAELSYQTLLGPLSKHQNLWQSWFAGKLGRSEIIAHGTAINPNYYKNKPYYPNTPSMGCLCSPEIWNKEGIRTYSAQQLWIDELKKLGGGKGYLLVVEIDH